MAAYKIRRSVTINGKAHWITANTEQEYAEKLAKAFAASGPSCSKEKHNFKVYALKWFELYSKPNIESVTQQTYKRQINRYLVPAFGAKAIEDITTDDVQALFNSMTGAKATKDKARMVFSMILDAAVEDGFIQRNPVKSKKIRIIGKPTEYTKCYTVDQMRYIVDHIGAIQAPVDRAYMALQVFHPMRLTKTPQITLISMMFR